MQSNEASILETQKIAKAYSKEEWDAIISLIPSERLGQEMIKRATQGEEKYKRMKLIWEEE